MSAVNITIPAVGARVTVTVIGGNGSGRTVTIDGTDGVKGFVPGSSAAKGEQLEATVVDTPAGKPVRLSVSSEAVVEVASEPVQPAAVVVPADATTADAGEPVEGETELGRKLRLAFAAAGQTLPTVDASERDESPSATVVEEPVEVVVAAESGADDSGQGSEPAAVVAVEPAASDAEPAAVVAAGSVESVPAQVEPVAVEPAVVSADDASETAFSEVGQKITGKVTNLLAKPVNGNPKERKPYGVLVELPEGGKGLLHVTELPGSREQREEALAKLSVGSEVTAAVKEVEEDKETRTRKVKLSVKLLEQQQQVAAYKDGDVVEGTVKRVESYGAIVQLAEVSGLVHVSQVPGYNLAARQAYLQALAVGDAVTATVIEVDLAEARIGLSVRPQARAQFLSEAHEGEEFEGAVVSVKDYGVLVNIGAAVGLVHVSQLPGKTREDRDSYLAGVRERFEARRNRSGKPSTPAEVLTVKVESIDRDKDRVALSMR